VTSAFGAREEWRHVRTENFEMLSAASEKKTRELVLQLEQFRASFIGTFGLRPAHEPRVTVVLFNSDRVFNPYKPTYQGKIKEVAGFFVGGTDEVVIALNTAASGEDGDDPTETIFHEYVHLLVHSRGLRLPTWLNEGLAELFSTFRLTKQTVEYGQPKQLYVDILNQAAMMPLSRLMAVTEASADYNEEMRAGMFYAQAWALAHFLVCGEDRTNAARLGRFIDTAGATGTGTVETFRELWGQDFDKLDLKLRNYLQGGRYYKRNAPAPLKDLAAKIVIRPATEFERDYALLNLRWRVHQSGDVMLAALQLAEKNPTSPRPQELLAAIAAGAGEFTRALERWRMAAELGSENPFALVQGVRAKLTDLGFEDDLDRRLPPEEADRLRGWLDRAIVLGPHYGDAVEMLAWVESRAPVFRIDAVNLIQKRVRELKDPNPTLLALAVIRWRAKDIATADNITQAVIDASQAAPHIKAAARLLRLRFAETAESVAPQSTARPTGRTAP
jgi:hypothetical protein